jgi:hypothetical protein
MASESFQEMPIRLSIGRRLADHPVNMPKHAVKMAGIHDKNPIGWLWQLFHKWCGNVRDRQLFHYGEQG